MLCCVVFTVVSCVEGLYISVEHLLCSFSGDYLSVVGTFYYLFVCL